MSCLGEKLLVGNSAGSTESVARQLSTTVTNDVVVRLVRLEDIASEMSFSDLSTRNIDSSSSSSPETCSSGGNKPATSGSPETCSSDGNKPATDGSEPNRWTEIHENESAALLNDKGSEDGELLCEDGRTSGAVVDGTLNASESMLMCQSMLMCDGSSLPQGNPAANHNSTPPGHMNAVTDADADGITEDSGSDHVCIPKVAARVCKLVLFSILIVLEF